MKTKTIMGYEGYYSITSEGTVYSHDRVITSKRSSNEYTRILKGKQKKSPIGIMGYVLVVLSKNGKKTTYTIHRLVAQHFIPNSKNKPCINHKSGNKLDNSITNLEWCTYKENTQHAMKNGLGNQRGEKAPNTKLTWKQVKEIRKNHNKESHKNQVWEKYKISRGHYYKIISYKKRNLV